MLKGHILYVLDNDRPVHPPIGGYLLILVWLALAVTNLDVAMETAANGDLIEATVLLLFGMPMFVFLIIRTFTWIDEVWANRSRPANLNGTLHKLRKLSIGVVPVFAIIDIFVFDQPLLTEIKLISVYLSGCAMLSFCLSLYAMTAKDAVSNSKETLQNAFSRG
ncbi:hypothetical protein ACFR9U_16055 [Halorientalis brevis]|uniref:DUF2975 domain-containing protein n=1 Tax=Halorientalis brevis TaxID=1126241 RepID=A0ABD6CE52_9EURY|nr:hypothetical protein [Halorientalis brevis]